MKIALGQLVRIHHSALDARRIHHTKLPCPFWVVYGADTWHTGVILVSESIGKVSFVLASFTDPLYETTLSVRRMRAASTTAYSNGAVFPLISVSLSFPSLIVAGCCCRSRGKVTVSY